MRRLPVYFLLDVSGSMYGEPIAALNSALRSLLNELNRDPQSIDSVALSIITFGLKVEELFPLTELPAVQLAEIDCPRSGPTFTGKALELLHEKVSQDVRKSTPEQKGDFRPLLFLFTDGKPSDVAVYDAIVPKIKALNFATIVGCAAGNLADETKLRQLTETVLHLETADSVTLGQFFQWVSSTIDENLAPTPAKDENSEQANEARDDGSTSYEDFLPPPPDEVNIII